MTIALGAAQWPEQFVADELRRHARTMIDDIDNHSMSLRPQFDRDCVI